MRIAPPFARSLMALVLAFLVAGRLLTPNGFMPAFDGGGVTIVVCPDADAAGAANDAHHQGHSKSLHQPCPYAPAPGLASLANQQAPLLALLILAVPLLLG